MTLPIAFFAQPCFRAASPDLAKLKGATELTLETPGVKLALAMDYYRIEVFKTEADRDLACGSTAHEDVRYFPIGREELISAGDEIESVGCGHTLDHPDFEQVFEPIFEAALRYLVGEMIQTTRPKNGPVATTVISIARARYTITVVAADDWFNFSVGVLCLFERADPELLERTGRYLEEQLILRLSPPPIWNAKAN
jgi:hypothetical protein